MYNFQKPDYSNFYGAPEAQIASNGILVESYNFVSQAIDIEQCLSHHLLMSWMMPQPVMVQGYFGSSKDALPLKKLGSLGFIPADVPTLSRYPVDESLRVMAIHFAPDMLEQLFEDQPFSYSLNSMANYDLHSQDILYGTKQLAKELLAPGFASNPLVESIGMDLLIRLARQTNPSSEKNICRGGLAPWQMRLITERVSDLGSNELPPPTLIELANLTGISVGHLRRAFKQSTHSTIGDYIRNTRFERARNLLSNTGLSIKEISSQLGFNAQYSFTVAFKRSAGETPSNFRQRTHAKHQS